MLTIINKLRFRKGEIYYGIKKDTEVEILVTGENEQAVLDEFVKMFEDGFGE